LPVSAGAVRELLEEIAASGGGEHTLAVGGADVLAPQLRQQLLRGRAEPGAVRFGDSDGADAYVHVLSGEVADCDVAVLRRARLDRVPVVVVAVGFAEVVTIPYVLSTDVVWADAGDDLPLGAVARAIAGRMGESGAPLAARVPLLREPVGKQLVSSFARKNGVAAAAGADLPVLALNELRLVLRVAQAHGAAGDVRDRLPELAATLGSAFGLRALARVVLGVVPAAGWTVRAGVAYAGTRALGEAARLRFELAPTQRQAGAARAAP
jgi:uncharacterized protein (DUF697 family)